MQSNNEEELKLLPNDDYKYKMPKSETSQTILSHSDASKSSYDELSVIEKQLVSNYRKELFNVVIDDDITKLLRASEYIPQTLPQLNIYSKLITQSGKYPNILYNAIENGKNNIALYLIDNCSKEYLFQTYTNIDHQIPPSNKTCLHLLSEMGNALILEALLKKLRSLIREQPDSSKIELKGMFDYLDDRFTIEGVLAEERVKDFLNAKFVYKIDKTLKRRFSALHVATFNAHIDIIRLLFEFPNDDSKNYVDVDGWDNENETALFWAVKKRQIKVFRELIKYGADINSKNKYETYPLHICVTENYEDLLSEMFRIRDIDLNVERVKNPRFAIAVAAEENKPHLVKMLLDQNKVTTDKDRKIKIDHIHDALMIATLNGNQDIIKIILNEHKELINRRDDFGNTPLMIATLNGNMDIFTLLFKSLDTDKLLQMQNNLNQSIFDLAMMQSNFTLLAFLVDYKRQSTEKIDFNEVFYLQKAAAKDDVEKFEFLISKCKINLLTVDENNNCFAHIAAYYDSCNVLEKFLKIEDDITEVQNSSGETPLHVAVRRGNINAVKSLLTKNSRLDLIDNDGQNILHAALSDYNVDEEIVKHIIETMSLRSNFAIILNAQDSFGDTALHIAAKYKHANFIKLLNKINFACENKDGETALHKACAYGGTNEIRIILKLFTSEVINKSKRLIDHKNEDGHSALFLVARQADIKKFEVLMEYAADLAVRNDQGYNFLYALIDGNSEFLEDSERYVAMYRTIVQLCVKWYCRKEFINIPLDNSPKYFYVKFTALRFLLMESCYDSYNVPQYAASKGTTQLLAAMLQTPDLFRFDIKSPIFKKDNPKLYKRDNDLNFKNIFSFASTLSLEEDVVLYDVTHFIPCTAPKQSKYDRLVHPTNSTDDDEIDKKYASTNLSLIMRPKMSNKSYIEIILKTGKSDYISDILSIEPFIWLVSKYWTFCRRGYEFFMWLHVIYMIMFTFLMTPTKHWIREKFPMNMTNYDYQLAHENDNFIFVVFLIWPILILVYELILFIHFIHKLRINARENRTKTTKQKILVNRFFKNISEVTSGMMRIPIGILFFILNNLSHCSSIIFGLSTITWFFLYIYTATMHQYLNCLALVFIIGWMHTINYVKGFKDWNALANIFKQIIKNDMTRFVYIYIFVLISFGYAFHVMLQADIYNETETSSTNTIYLTFVRMLSPGNILDISEQAGYKDSMSSLAILKSICSCYLVLSTVVLMNMLIAMMNSSYSKIESNKSNSWRVESLHLILFLEKMFPRIFNPRLFNFKNEYDESNKRWYLTHVPGMETAWDNDLHVDTSLDQFPSTKETGEVELKNKLEYNNYELKAEIEDLKREVNSHNKIILNCRNEIRSLHEICLENNKLIRRPQ